MSHDESTYRRKWKKLYQTIKQDEPQNTSLSDIDKLKIEQNKLQTQKIEYNKWLREYARDEMIKNDIVTAINNLPELQAPKPRSIKRFDRSFLLCLSDVHYGIEFEIKDLQKNILNAYSPEIFEQRMQTLFSHVVDFVKTNNVEELNVFELGDSIQGILRLNSQLMKLRYGIIDSAIYYANYLSTWLNELSKYTHITFHMVMDSNHNQIRLLNAPKNAFPEENLSKIIWLFITERLKNNSNIKFIEGVNGLIFSELSSYNVLGVHGELKNMTNAINAFSRIYKTNIDYLIGGHIHHANSTEIGINSEILQVRSIMGVDPYSMSIMKTANAGASIFVFEKNNGKVCEYTIKLN